MRIFTSGLLGILSNREVYGRAYKVGVAAPTVVFCQGGLI